MLNYGILSLKNTIKLPNATEECIDLLPRTVKKSISSVKGTPLIVNEYYVARPDLISLACYNTDLYADLICKINGISNPFELQEDTVLVIPSMGDITQLFLNNIKTSEIVKDSVTNNDKTNINKKSNTRVGSLNINTQNQKQLNEKRSPAEQIIGDTNYTINRELGLVFY